MLLPFLGLAWLAAFAFVGAWGVRTEGSLYQMRARYYDPAASRFHRLASVKNNTPPKTHQIIPRPVKGYFPMALGNCQFDVESERPRR